MTRTCIVFAAAALALALPRPAIAQAPGQTEPPSAPFLEKRIPEELATEGVLLARNNLSLQIEQLADKWLVSLVDLTTGRVAASTKVDALPRDREAAVASLTHVVADLVNDVIGRRGAPAAAPPPAAPAPQPGLIDDRPERAAREVAELKYRRQSFRFGAELSLVTSGTGTTTTVGVARRWVVYQGDLDQQVEPVDFYAQVGRPDLGDAYKQRRILMYGGFVVGTIAAVTSVGIVLSHSTPDCANLQGQAYTDCRDNGRLDLTAPLVLFGVSGVGYLVGYYLYYHPHPISENEAKSLADAYNQGLRRQLGLPVVTQRTRLPALHDVHLTPYVAGSQAGLALSARF